MISVVVSEAFFVADYLAISALIFEAMSIKISVAISTPIMLIHI